MIETLIIIFIQNFRNLKIPIQIWLGSVT